MLCVNRCDADTCCQYVTHKNEETCFIDGVYVGYWKLTYWGELKTYTEAKAECSSLGASLVGEDNVDEVRFVCHFPPLIGMGLRVDFDETEFSSAVFLAYYGLFCPFVSLKE